MLVTIRSLLTNIGAWLFGMCATTYKNAYIIVLWVLGTLRALIWMLMLRMSKTRTSGASRE
jgi:hypothetical protein